jgi:hypothetical protein
MTVKELREKLLSASDRFDDNEVCVVITKPNNMGGIPTVNVKLAAFGFDWNNGQLLLWAENDLKLNKQD